MYSNFARSFAFFCHKARSWGSEILRASRSPLTSHHYSPLTSHHYSPQLKPKLAFARRST